MVDVDSVLSKPFGGSPVFVLHFVPVFCSVNGLEVEEKPAATGDSDDDADGQTIDPNVTKPKVREHTKFVSRFRLLVIAGVTFPLFFHIPNLWMSAYADPCT